MNRYDVAILGGGPAGCATALGLVQRGIDGERILLLSPPKDPGKRTGESLPPDSRLLLSRLGILDQFLADQHEPCHGSCSSWGQDSLGYNDFLLNPLGHGWHLDRQRFDDFLSQAAKDTGIVVSSTEKYHGSKFQSNQFELQLKKADGKIRTVNASFVVDATGHHASFAKHQGARKLFLDRLICIYGFFALPEQASLSSLTLLEATEYGWWYAARLPNRQLTIVLASDVELIKARRLVEREQWMAHLGETRHIAKQWEFAKLIDDEMHVCPAHTFRLHTAVGKAWLAVGDAAASYDPISSQGIHKAMANGLDAAETIVDSIKGNQARIEQYSADHVAGFDDYLNNRNYFYDLEQRWSQASFWRQRKERTTLVL